MLDQLLINYEKLNNETYRIFEVFHYAVMNKLVPEKATIIEMELLNAINNLSKQDINHPTEIAEKRKISITTLSNQLHRLEKLGFIKRTVNQDNWRKRDITITSLGFESIETIDEYFNKLQDAVAKEYSGITLFRIMNILVSLSNHISRLEPIDLNKLRVDKYKKYVTNALSNIIYELNTIESEFIDELDNTMTIRDLIVLQSIYRKAGEATIVYISEYLIMPFTTIASKINRYEKLGYLTKVKSEIDKRKFCLILTKEGKTLVEGFMKMRVDSNLRVQNLMKPSEYQLIVKGYKIVESNSKAYL